VKILTTLVLTIALAACGKSTEKGPPLDPPVGSGTATEVAAGSGSATGSGSAGSGSAAEPVDIPTAMDYEDLAHDEITANTVDDRVKALEAELAPQ